MRRHLYKLVNRQRRGQSGILHTKIVSSEAHQSKDQETRVIITHSEAKPNFTQTIEQLPIGEFTSEIDRLGMSKSESRTCQPQRYLLQSAYGPSYGTERAWSYRSGQQPRSGDRPPNTHLRKFILHKICNGCFKEKGRTLHQPRHALLSRHDVGFASLPQCNV